ncbi:hypothetical protein [Candidatus Harpocratesius sp.]
MGRNYLEMNEDKAYLLYLISIGEIQGNIKLVKLIFFINLEAKKLRSIGKVFHYDFVKWHNGPYSKWIQNDVESLINGGLIEKKEKNLYRITEEGKYLLKDLSNNLNQDKLNLISDIHSRINSMKTPDVLEKVYNLDEVKNKKFGESILLSR